MERSQWLYSGMDYFDAASGGPSPAAAGFLRTLLQSNDGDCSDNDEVITTRTFVINIILVIVLFFLLLGVFVWLRGYEIFDMTFHPNLCVNFEELDYPVQATPPEVRAHRLQFIARALKLNEPDLLLYSGLDEMMFVRWLRFNALLFLGLSVFFLPILLPIYRTGDLEDTDTICNNVDLFSLANVPKGDWRFIVGTVLLSLLTWLTASLLRHEWVRYRLLRWAFSISDRQTRTFSVFVSDVPNKAGEDDRYDESGFRKKHDDSLNKMAAVMDAGASIKGAAMESGDAIGTFLMDFLPGRIISNWVKMCLGRTKNPRRRRAGIISRTEMDTKVETMFKGIFKDDYLHHHQAEDTRVLDALVPRRRALAQKLIRLSSPLVESEDVTEERAKTNEHELREHKIAIHALSLADKGIGREGSPLRSFRTITAARGESMAAIAETDEELHEEVSPENVQGAPVDVSASVPIIEEEVNVSVQETVGSGAAPQAGNAGASSSSAGSAGASGGDDGVFETPRPAVEEAAGGDSEGDPISPSMTGLTTKDSRIEGVAPELKSGEEAPKSKKQLRQERKERKKLEKLLAEIEATEAEIEALDLAIDEEEARLDADENSVENSFVTFRTRYAAAVASQSLLENDINEWNTDLAPAPSDVVWKNLRYGSRARRLINLKINLVGAIIVIFFFLPVQGVKWLVQESQNWWSNTFGEFGRTLYSILIALVLVIFLVLAHIVSLLLSRQSGHVAFSRMDGTGAWIYFWLILVNVLLVNIIGNEAVWVELRHWIEDPGSIPERLSRNVAVTGATFMQVVALRWGQSLPLELLHIPFHLGFFTKAGLTRIKSGKVPYEERARLAVPEGFPVHRVIPQCFLAFTPGFIYAVIAPLILPFCFVFFLTAHYVWKHNVVYHYRQRYLNGGQVFPLISDFTFVSILLTHLLYICMLAINDSPYQVIVIGVMIVYTIIVWIDIKFAFDKNDSAIPLRHVIDARPLNVDEKTGDVTHTYYVRADAEGKQQRVVEKVNDMYKPPCLRKRVHFRNIKLTEGVDSYYNIATTETVENSTEDNSGRSQLAHSTNGTLRMRETVQATPIVGTDLDDEEGAPGLRPVPSSRLSSKKV